jgi:hypothetical protein
MGFDNSHRSTRSSSKDRYSSAYPAGVDVTYQKQESSELRTMASQDRKEVEMVLPSDYLLSCLQYQLELPLSIFIRDIELDLKFPEG